MAEAALVIYLLYLGSAFGLRSLWQWRSTGSTGFVGVGGRADSAEWTAGVLFVAALLVGLAAPILAIADAIGTVPALEPRIVAWVGLVLALAGAALTVYAQSAMGTSWRIGVKRDERTELVTEGPFTVVRNPIFAAMVPTALGLALMIGNVVALAGFVLLAVALELQVRIVEEPYLINVHGSGYLRYAAGVGRFIPGIGELDDQLDGSRT